MFSAITGLAYPLRCSKGEGGGGRGKGWGRRAINLS